MLPKGLAHCLSTVLLPVLLVAGCKGAGARAAAVAGSGSQPFQGLYLQTQWAGTAMQYVHYYFWHDGRICQVRPTGGLDREPADFAALQKQAIAEGHACGTYALHGKSMTVAMNGAANPGRKVALEVPQNGVIGNLKLALLLSFNDVPALCENPVFHFVSTWLLDQYTMDEVTKYSVNTRPRGY